MCGWREARRIYVTGGPCSGVSTLGRAVAARLDLRLVDVEALAPGGDDPAPDAAARLRTCLGASGWLLCGPAEGRGDAILRDRDRILYLLAGSQTRLARRIATTAPRTATGSTKAARRMAGICGGGSTASSMTTPVSPARPGAGKRIGCCAGARPFTG
ncbi:hypothetical protein PE067_00090 [Paracoccus sp. DMF-8]|uniref:hypothetical protein n=1 Tax=Paracoccus sp. DMF-8 TaxID=3019445 RepID=UPI0023E7C0E2|nr:hypothetical protein [Paracoccus sp. DMF-8]MDF3604695.1 hypothetical protein [Paracoccus sp. DMF-8]